VEWEQRFGTKHLTFRQVAIVAPIRLYSAIAQAASLMAGGRSG